MVRLEKKYSSELCHLGSMRTVVREACAQAGWNQPKDAETIVRLELALSEAAANIILHAYEGKTDQPIEFGVEVDETQICVTLHHDGAPFDPAAAAAPVFDGTREGGFGLYLIRRCVDEVEYFQNELGRCGIRLVQKRP